MTRVREIKKKKSIHKGYKSELKNAKQRKTKISSPGSETALELVQTTLGHSEIAMSGWRL